MLQVKMVIISGGYWQGKAYRRSSGTLEMSCLIWLVVTWVWTLWKFIGSILKFFSFFCIQILYFSVYSLHFMRLQKLLQSSVSASQLEFCPLSCFLLIVLLSVGMFVFCSCLAGLLGGGQCQGNKPGSLLTAYQVGPARVNKLDNQSQIPRNDQWP